jgi:hypothetical protein
LFCNVIYDYLDAVLDFGVMNEQEFWVATLAEIDRAIASKKRVIKIQEQKQAINDYMLADLIGHSVARIHSKTAKMPTLSEAYPSLFDTEEEQERIQEQKDELTILRFKQFAQAHNSKYKEGKE